MARSRGIIQTLHLNGCLLALLFSVLVQSGCIQQGVYHTIEPGQTLYRISKVYEVDEAYLARINGIPNPTQLRVGSRVYIPGATQTLYVPSTVPGYAPPAASAPTSVRPAPPRSEPPVAPVRPPRQEVRPPVARPAPVVVKPAAPVTRPNSGVVVSLDWPLRGKILRSFGESGKGGGKGVEIAAREGSLVKAAAAGKVIYSGDGVQGFGHLMILQHENDLFTVYGFNSRNHAKQGQFVSQGEKIASSGRPPSGDSGRLHFEVRLGKVAVNPILYLP